jgi:hypothetical protein
MAFKVAIRTRIHPCQQAEERLRQLGVHETVNRPLPNACEPIDIDDIESDIEEIDPDVILVRGALHGQHVTRSWLCQESSTR